MYSGWGLHKRQADRYFVISGNLRMVLRRPRGFSGPRARLRALFHRRQRRSRAYPAGRLARHALLVRRRESGGHLRADVDRVVRRQRSAVEAGRQRLPLVPGHGEIPPAVLRPGLAHRADAGMDQARDRAEIGEAAGATGADPQPDEMPAAPVAGAEGRRLLLTAEAFEDLVMGECAADQPWAFRADPRALASCG
jgi:hypothetical protein